MIIENDFHENIQKKDRLTLINLPFFTLRLTWPFPPHSPAGDFSLVRITTFLSRFSRQGLHLRRAMLTLYIFDKAYVGPFARVWLGLAATDSQSFFILLYLHCFCQTKVFQICFLFTLVTMSQMTSLIYAYYDIIYIIICIPYRKLQQKEYYDYET